MKSDCIGCPYFVDFGSGEKMCTAPSGCRLDGIISGLLED